MKCKDVQFSIGVGGNLAPDAAVHAAQCGECRAFTRVAAGLDAEIPWLDASPPASLRSRIADRFGRPRWRLDWRTLAVSAAIVAIITTPVFTILANRSARQFVKGDRIGTLPPFHVKFYGKDFSPHGESSEGEGWFNGYAFRVTMPGMDTIEHVEGTKIFQDWRPGGVLQRRQQTWAKGHQPVSRADQVERINRIGPVFPNNGLKIMATGPAKAIIFGRRIAVMVTVFRLKNLKTFGNLPGVMPASEEVYQDQTSGRIVRINISSTAPEGFNQVELRDYEYETPSDAKFETTTLLPTQTNVTAKYVPPKKK